MAEAASPSSHSSFCEEVFSVVATSLWGVTRRAQRDGYRPNEVDRTNILAPGFAFFPPSPPKFLGDWPNWEVVSSYSSATAPDSHGISCADPLFQARKERSNGILPMITGSKPMPRLGTCARRVKIYLINQTV